MYYTASIQYKLGLQIYQPGMYFHICFFWLSIGKYTAQSNNQQTIKSDRPYSYSCEENERRKPP